MKIEEQINTIAHELEKEKQAQVQMDVNELTQRIIGCAFTVHNALGTGFLEKVYENALLVELKANGLEAVQQKPVSVYYRDVCVGAYYADLVVEDRILVELKAVQNLTREHEVQLVNYLNATGYDDGLLLNFGPSVEVKRKFRDYVSKKPKE